MVRVVFFDLGLTLIVVGTGLLKGNVSVIVGRLYSMEDSRRDAGYSIFYMGINTGAFIAPLICGYLGQRVDWRAGFAAAGVGMTIGLVQYTLGRKYLGAAGLAPADAGSPAASARQKSQAARWTGLTVSAIVIFGLAAYSGIVSVTVDSHLQLTAVRLRDASIDASKRDAIEKAIVEAVNGALQKVVRSSAESLSQLQSSDDWKSAIGQALKGGAAR